MTFNPQDRFFKQAKKEGYKARSVYKLEEIHKKFKIIKSGDWVIDLGASPGSWSQWLNQAVGPKGYVLGFDLTKMDLKLERAEFFVQDVFTLELGDFLKQKGFPEKVNVVVSDMAPQTTGIKQTDQLRSHELSLKAFQVAQSVLKTNGHFVVKYFEGSQIKDFLKLLKGSFKRVELIKPESTRSRSFEIFIVGIHFIK